jgi:hypothetical protein
MLSAHQQENFAFVSKTFSLYLAGSFLQQGLRGLEKDKVPQKPSHLSICGT